MMHYSSELTVLFTLFIDAMVPTRSNRKFKNHFICHSGARARRPKMENKLLLHFVVVATSSRKKYNRARKLVRDAHLVVPSPA
jgi:hypothetical protein